MPPIKAPPMTDAEALVCLRALHRFETEERDRYERLTSSKREAFEVLPYAIRAKESVDAIAALVARFGGPAHLQLFPVGTRVRTRESIERFPHFALGEEGLTGTVVACDDRIVSVRMDVYIEGAEEWDNEVCWYEDDLPYADRQIEPITEPLALPSIDRLRVERSIETREDAVTFIELCVEIIGAGFHPDTPFGNYTDPPGMMFDRETARRLDGYMHDACGLTDAYEVGLDAMRRLYPAFFGPPADTEDDSEA